MVKPLAMLVALLAVLLLTVCGCLAAEPSPHVWIGTTPFCTASQKDCDVLGLHYIRSDKAGDGLPCFSGAKVLCEAPPIAVKPAEPDRLTRFTVVQYNIMDRPFWVGHEGQRERVCRIPQALVRNVAAQEYVDVLVFNESFSGLCAGDLRLTDLLAHYGWPHHLPAISTWWKPSNGGIFIASKWPIVTSQDMVYTACRLPDCLAAKGVQYARVEKSLAGRTKLYHVFGTHMQAWGGAESAAVRREQSHEMAAFIGRQAIPSTQPVLLAGDFNTRGPGNPQFQSLIDTLRVSMPPIVGERRGTMDVDNTLFGRGPWWVDYVLPSTVHQHPMRAELEALALRPEAEFTLCVEAAFWPFYVSPYASTCTAVRRVRDLSDHYPVIGRFEYAE
ncbi:MAG TPA: sphingomyelin phosphodiesterase [Candidatus Tectomicrobia bacterium]|nr:sphingomyelin phosphodiesterase [Candidatus Tectomicrobia bacterium]